MRNPLLLVAVPAAAFLLAACGGDDGGEPVSRAITAADLTSLVLAREELGAKFAGLEPFPGESRPITNAEAVRDASDPEDERADIERFGRVAGYHSVFQGAALISEVLTLYETADGANGAFDDMMEELPEEIRTAVEHVEIEGFAVGEIGDEAQGLLGRVPQGLNFVAVSTRVGRLVAFIQIVVSPMSPLAREDEMKEDVRQLGLTQAEKIEAAR